MKGLISKVLIGSLLLICTVTAYGGCFYGWFLPEPLKKPVNLREGSSHVGARGLGLYWLGTRSHYGGGYRGGK